MVVVVSMSQAVTTHILNIPLSIVVTFISLALPLSMMTAYDSAGTDGGALFVDMSKSHAHIIM